MILLTIYKEFHPKDENDLCICCNKYIAFFTLKLITIFQLRSLIICFVSRHFTLPPSLRNKFTHLAAIFLMICNPYVKFSLFSFLVVRFHKHNWSMRIDSVQCKCYEKSIERYFISSVRLIPIYGIYRA